MENNFLRKHGRYYTSLAASALSQRREMSLMCKTSLERIHDTYVFEYRAYIRSHQQHFCVILFRHGADNVVTALSIRPKRAARSHNNNNTRSTKIPRVYVTTLIALSVASLRRLYVHPRK